MASRLKERGHEPAILSRGYRRRVPEKWTVLEAGATARPSRTGDEAQLFLRSGVAHVGIGADRHATGRRLEERLHPSVILLDDGFQHWRLARDLDIVLIDALDPFAGHALFPLGRQRERLEELARADAFVISRTEPGSPVTGIVDQLHEYNSTAPVFVSRVRPEAWVDVASGETLQPSFIRGHCHGAFCALANPSSFWRTLASLGCRPVHRWTFGDHHHYGPQELKRMAAEARAGGAEALLTTEKDLMNLPAYAGKLVEPTRLLWLRIGMSIEREGELLRLIEDRVRAKAVRVPAPIPEKILRDGEASP